MKLIENPYVSEFTKKTLEQFGWKPGDPIPEELGDTLVAIRDTLPPTTNTGVLVDVTTMTADDVQKVQALLAQAKVVAQHEKDAAAKNEQLANLAPGVAQEYAKVMDQLSVVDDREEAAAKEQVPQPAAPTPPPEPPPQSAPPAEEEPELTTGGLADAVPFCPRCGWDVRQKYEVEPTQRDKEDFLATLLGRSRFKKEYELFGGRLKVTFRGLLAEENKLIYRQLVVDQQAGRIGTEAEWFLNMMDYRLACSLEQIVDKAGQVVSLVPELQIQGFDPPPDRPLETPLPAQLKYIDDHVLAQEVTRRLVGTHLRQFQRLVEALEAMALEPSFWNGIE